MVFQLMIKDHIRTMHARNMSIPGFLNARAVAALIVARAVNIGGELEPSSLFYLCQVYIMVSQV